MKKLHYTFVLISLLFTVLLFSCATTKVDKPEEVKKETTDKVVPPENLPELTPDKNISLVPKQTKYENIYVKKFVPEISQDNLVDVYIYDLQKKKYVCFITKCYFDTIQQENFTGSNVLWSAWAKDNAYFLIDSSRYKLCDEDGKEY